MATRVPVQRQEPTMWQKMKMGALMGAGVGLTIGFLFGSYNILRQGAGPRGFTATLSQYMLSSAATFSFFLAIGSVIRNDAHSLPSSYTSRQTPIVLRSRAESAAIRADWATEFSRRRS